jgi:hypothetical protein
VSLGSSSLGHGVRELPDPASLPPHGRYSGSRWHRPYARPWVLEAANLTSILDPTFYPNAPQHHPTQTYTPGQGSPETPLPQGIIRHGPTPGHPLAGLEQNPAYGTAQAHR